MIFCAPKPSAAETTVAGIAAPSAGTPTLVSAAMASRKYATACAT